MFKGMNKSRKNRKGFTLTELIVVVAILGILAAVAVPSVLGYLDNARVNTDTSNAKALESAILRNIANNRFSLPASATNAEIEPIIDDELEIPDVQQAGMGFYMDPNTGRVRVLTPASATGLVLLEGIDSN